MFRKTSSQMSMLESQFLLPEVKRQRLERSWAHAFRTIVLPLIDEELFRESFHHSDGRPNKSIRLMVSLAILKEMNDLTDTEVIDALEFNLQFHYALGVEPQTAHVCQKTLHNHRLLMLESDRSRQVFERVTRGLAEADGLKLGRQRLDSTHVMSNIAVLTRLTLFVETVTSFLRALRRDLPAKLELLDSGYVHRYLEREGYFSDAKRRQARRRIRAVASDLHRLVVAFKEDRDVSSLPEFALLKRLFEEQCEVVTEDEPQSEPVCVAPEEEDEDEVANEDSVDEDKPVESKMTETCATRDVEQIRLREGKEISSSSLQSPHDPDATYGHKGKGYEVQVAETCEADNGYQVITAISVNGANESDQTVTIAVVEQLAEAGLSPTELYADMGYGSGANIVACAERGVDLQAPVRDPKTPETPDKMGEPIQAQTLIDPPPESDADEDAAPADDAGEPAPQVAGDAQPDDSPDSLPEEGVDKLTVGDFTFGPEFKRVIGCPAGNEAVSQHMDGARKKIWARFSSETCEGCPLAPQCPTRRLKSGVRTLQTSSASAATKTRQREQKTSEFKERYKIRSGIESTNAELKSRHGAGAMRVRGQERVEMSMQMKATAVNVKRATFWHAAQPPPETDAETNDKKIASLREYPESPVEIPQPSVAEESPPPEEPSPPEAVVAVPWLTRLTRHFLEPFRVGAGSLVGRNAVMGGVLG